MFCLIFGNDGIPIKLLRGDGDGDGDAPAVASFRCDATPGFGGAELLLLLLLLLVVPAASWENRGGGQAGPSICVGLYFYTRGAAITAGPTVSLVLVLA